VQFIPLKFPGFWGGGGGGRGDLGGGCAYLRKPQHKLLGQSTWPVGGSQNPETSVIPYPLLMRTLLSAWGIVGGAVAWTTRVGVSGFVMLALSGAGIRTCAHLLIPSNIVFSSMTLALLLPLESMQRWELWATPCVGIALWVVREVSHSLDALRSRQSRPARLR